MNKMKSFVLIAGMIISYAVSGQGVKWYTLEQAIALNKKEPRKIMIDVYTDWCGWCKKMDITTFNNNVIADYLNSKYYPVKFNAEQKENITIDTTTFKYIAQGARGYHELAAVLLKGEMSYPSVVFLNEKVQIFYINRGYKEAIEFDGILKFFGGDFYLNNTWDKWIAGYKSPIVN
jgi:thioredoxin-related protein